MVTTYGVDTSRYIMNALSVFGLSDALDLELGAFGRKSQIESTTFLVDSDMKTGMRRQDHK